MDDTLILCYHAVASGWDDPVAVSEQRFAAQMSVLHRLGYTGVTFTEAVSGRGHGGGRRVAVTFDDAFRSVLDRARPILDAYSWPATVFAVSDYGTGDRVIDWPRLDVWLGSAFEPELRVLTWSELRELRDAGWEVGSHTRTHPRLTQLSLDVVRRELEDSREACTKELGSCSSLAYPYGDVNPAVVDLARQVGYETAAALPTQLHGVRPLEWPRVGIYNIDHLPRFLLKAAPLRRRLAARAA